MSTHKNHIIVWFAVVLGIGSLGAATTQLLAECHLRCCARCRCPESRKVCKLECEEKKVSIECYGCLAEDFCLPGRSCERCRKCTTVCGECAKAGETQSQPKLFSWGIWQPKGCAEMAVRHKLMKRTVSKKVPVYKWVVVDLCKECLSKEEPVKVASDVVLPPIPVVADDVVVLTSHQIVPTESQLGLGEELYEAEVEDLVK